MNPLNRFPVITSGLATTTEITSGLATTTEKELTPFSEQFERVERQPRTTMKQELETFFKRHKPFLPVDLARVIAGYADENGVLAMRNSQGKTSAIQFDGQQYQEEIGAIMCAFSALPSDFSSVHKQIMMNGFTRAGLVELVKIFNEMSRIQEKVNIDCVKFSCAILNGPCKLNYLSAIGAQISHVRFEKIELRGANLNESMFHTVDFVDVDLRNACMSGVLWENVGFENVDITGLNTNDKRLVRFMEDHQKKNPGARVILDGLLNLHGLTLDKPKPSDKKCSVM